MKNILITGANGQVGSALLQQADSSPYNMTFTTRETLDISDRKAIDEFLQANEYHYLINCAAYTQVDQAEADPDNCYMINRDAVGILAEACAKNQIIFLHISSDYVYHPDHNNVMSESEPTNPRGLYAASKLAGDVLALRNNPKTIILRTSWVYAQNGKNFVNTIARLARESDSLTVINDQIGSPTFAPDIAKALLEIIINLESGHIDEDKFGIYHFSNEGFISWFDFASEIVSQLNINCKVNACTSEQYPTAAPRPLNSRLSKVKIINTFGIEIKEWKTSLQKCLKQ